MMVIYVPGCRIFYRSAIYDCFSSNAGGTRSNWVVPGTWPEWML